MSSERTARETRFIVYERDEHGSAFAIEIVEAERWADAFIEPPDPERADARIVRLRSDELIPDIPRWLAVEPLPDGSGERRDASLRVAETDAEYRTRETEEQPAADRGAADLRGSLGGQLWPWSPTYRPPGPGLNEFLAAAAAAARHPDPVPTELRRRIEVLTEFAAERPPPFAQLATLRGTALERWLRYNFDDPDDLADTILLERMSDDGAREAVEALRFLRASRIPSSLTQYAELAIDRRVLLEQASPWRYFDGAPFQSAISAVQAWRRRYRLAYDQHYRSCQRPSEDAARALEEATLAASALERLDRLQTLGPPGGSLALAALSEARTAIGAVPREPDPDAAQTGGVTLGLEPPPGCRDARGHRERIGSPRTPATPPRLGDRTSHPLAARRPGTRSATPGDRRQRPRHDRTRDGRRAGSAHRFPARAARGNTPHPADRDTPRAHGHDVPHSHERDAGAGRRDVALPAGGDAGTDARRPPGLARGPKLS